MPNATQLRVCWTGIREKESTKWILCSLQAESSPIGRQTNQEGSRRASDQPGGITIQTNPQGSQWASDQPPGITEADLIERRGSPLLSRSTSRTASSIRTSRVFQPHLGKEKHGWVFGITTKIKVRKAKRQIRVDSLNFPTQNRP